MILSAALASLTVVSVVLVLWQIVVAARLPLHRPIVSPEFLPAVSLLKPLKGCDRKTIECLRSWLKQHYTGPIQLLFGVASPEDPVCPVVRGLLAECPGAAAQLVVCGETLGPNAKVSQLVQLERLARHEVICVSDA